MTINWTPPEGTRITYPRRGLDDKDFNFKRGSDVQALWREYGWVHRLRASHRCRRCVMPRPKPPEPLNPRQIRMSDSQWEAFQAWGGADRLRQFLAAMPKHYVELFKNGPA